MQKGLASLILLGFIAMIVILGLFYWSKVQVQPQPQTVINDEQSPQVFQNSIKPSVDGETTLYTSTVGNFTIRYPNEWLLISNQICQACLENIEFNLKRDPNLRVGGIGVYELELYPDAKTIDDYVEKYLKKNRSIGEIKFITLGGERAVSYRYLNGVEPLNLRNYSVIHNNQYYVMGLEGTPELVEDADQNIEMFDQMLSTLEFSK